MRSKKRKILALSLVLLSLLFLTSCNMNDMVGGIFNGIWSSRFTPYIIVGIIIFYFISKRNSGGK